MTKHTATTNISSPPTAAQRAHAGDERYFREHSQALWRVRPAVRGEFEDDDGYDCAPSATHTLILTDAARSRWSGKPLRLPAGVTDAEAEAAGVAVLLRVQ